MKNVLQPYPVLLSVVFRKTSRKFSGGVNAEIETQPGNDTAWGPAVVPVFLSDGLILPDQQEIEGELHPVICPAGAWQEHFGIPASGASGYLHFAAAPVVGFPSVGECFYQPRHTGCRPVQGCDQHLGPFRNPHFPCIANGSAARPVSIRRTSAWCRRRSSRRDKTGLLRTGGCNGSSVLPENHAGADSSTAIFSNAGDRDRIDAIPLPNENRAGCPLCITGQPF